MSEQNTIAYLIQSGFLASFAGETTSWLILVTAFTLLAAISTYHEARNKGRSVVGWVSLALAIPLVTLVLIALLPVLPAPE